MRMLTSLCRLARAGLLIASFASAYVTTASAEGERSNSCGYVYPVEGYQADIGDIHISLPVNDRLLVNGQVVAEHTVFDDQSAPQPWGDSANRAYVAVTPSDILIRTDWTDCVDYSWSRIYVLDRTGALRATRSLEGSGHPNAFWVEAGDLIYSSEWFCRKDSGATVDRTFVYILRRGSGTFEKQDRAWAEVCGKSPHRESLPLYFAQMEPILQPPTPDPSPQSTD
jgi:hypothetical protein